MEASTRGIEMRSGSRILREAIELLSSMRFSISLLTLICIASVIGTVVKQNEPAGNYVNQFGPFWAEVFTTAGITEVYSSWWFLVILGVLVISTSLCVARNTPKILADLQHYKENIREQALGSFHHRGQAELDETPEQAYARITGLLAGQGWRAKVQERRDDGVLRGTMIAARKGAANKLGYIAAHTAIVLICIGGLFDGDLIMRAQMLLLGKSAYNGSGVIRDVPAKYRLGPATPTFRGTLGVPEGSRLGTAQIAQRNGVVLLDLPFDIELKKFVVEFYPSGMPRLFASHIVIHDHETGEAIPSTVKVNEPVFHRGVAIYQSSFDDGGSRLKMRALPMLPGAEGYAFEGVVGSSAPLPPAGPAPAPLTLEITGLRAINVENFGAPSPTGPTDLRKVDLVQSLQNHLGSGAKSAAPKDMRNVGASMSYKLRDAAGQAREYNTYMAPVELDGQRVFLNGVRDSPADNFRYLRIPVDDEDSIDGWLRLRRALAAPALRAEAARRYVALATPADKPEMGPQLTIMSTRTLALFSGAEAVVPGEASPAGLAAMSLYLEKNVPEPDRQRISELLLRILNGSLFELLNLSREKAGQPPLTDTPKSQGFMTSAVLSLSDSFSYPAPVLLELMDYTQVQASVFQVARAPGKTLVYLGCFFLIAGVFAMFYIRERRLWIWLQASGSGTRLSTAMSTARRTLDADAEFEQLKLAILKGRTR